MLNKLIINLYVPINTILSCNESWKESLFLPKITNYDIKLLNELKTAYVPHSTNYKDQRQMLVDANLCLTKVKMLSFYSFLLQRLINEATICANKGYRNLLIENSNSPYFNHPVIYWLMRSLVAELKLRCSSEFKLGIKLNDNLDEWAIDIACRNNLDFIIIKDKNNKRIGNLCLLRSLMENRNVKIYNDSEAHSITQQGMIIDTEGLQKEEILQKVKKYLFICDYIKNNAFVPQQHKPPVIVDLWDEEQIKFFADIADYVILNACVSKNTYCDCGIDETKLNIFDEQGE